jgi:hypothetical protein
MSQASSDLDNVFGEATESGFEDQGLTPQPQIAPVTQYRKQGFSIYTVMLILSFVFLTAAAIVFFMDVGKY